MRHYNVANTSIPAMRCRLEGLSGAAHLNGQDCDVLGCDARGRVVVRLADGSRVMTLTRLTTYTTNSWKKNRNIFF